MTTWSLLQAPRCLLNPSATASPVWLGEAGDNSTAASHFCMRNCSRVHVAVAAVCPAHCSTIGAMLMRCSDKHGP